MALPSASLSHGWIRTEEEKTDDLQKMETINTQIRNLQLLDDLAEHIHNTGHLLFQEGFGFSLVCDVYGELIRCQIEIIAEQVIQYKWSVGLSINLDFSNSIPRISHTAKYEGKTDTADEAVKAVAKQVKALKAKSALKPSTMLRRVRNCFYTHPMIALGNTTGRFGNEGLCSANLKHCAAFMHKRK
ncbi:hypothetical protein L3V16_20875 [Brucella ciceri]|uniref:hypothetical protein n=1 Tax=Brucella ciceri TaxID=391287 RepID=UPI001F13B584|nr:hypothetical protein [Brucella ciceri]MCH6206280.1 hypothetical protein [Brucella ciceri]